MSRALLLLLLASCVHREALSDEVSRIDAVMAPSKDLVAERVAFEGTPAPGVAHPPEPLESRREPTFTEDHLRRPKGTRKRHRR